MCDLAEISSKDNTGFLPTYNEDILSYNLFLTTETCCHSPTQPQPQFNLNLSWELHENG
jgi:hypothetical protein